jgi:hypothetical protein
MKEMEETESTSPLTVDPEKIREGGRGLWGWIKIPLCVIFGFAALLLVIKGGLWGWRWATASPPIVRATVVMPNSAVVPIRTNPTPVGIGHVARAVPPPVFGQAVLFVGTNIVNGSFTNNQELFSWVVEETRSFPTNQPVRVVITIGEGVINVDKALNNREDLIAFVAGWKSSIRLPAKVPSPEEDTAFVDRELQRLQQEAALRGGRRNSLAPADQPAKRPVQPTLPPLSKPSGEVNKRAEPVAAADVVDYGSEQQEVDSLQVAASLPPTRKPGGFRRWWRRVTQPDHYAVTAPAYVGGDYRVSSVSAPYYYHRNVYAYGYSSSRHRCR